MQVSQGCRARPHRTVRGLLWDSVPACCCRLRAQLKTSRGLSLGFPEASPMGLVPCICPPGPIRPWGGGLLLWDKWSRVKGWLASDPGSTSVTFVSGMGKEVGNLLLENSQLLETK